MDLMWNVRSVFFMFIVLIWNSLKRGDEVLHDPATVPLRFQ